jgi:hypothetical protein
VKYTQEVVRIPLDDATLVDMAFKVATLPDGRFVSAEFTKPGVRPYWHSVKELEYDYGVIDEEITGLPEQPASYTFEQVLGKLDGVERASRIQIMYVMLRGSVSGGARPAFIANVYGVSALYSSVPLPNRNEFSRIRHVFDESLKPLYSDNVL